MPSRKERLAANEVRFRELNESAQPRRAAEPAGSRFVCECADNSCARWIAMTPEEYAAVREHPRRFIVAPTHEVPDVETVIERHPGYYVIEKPPEVDHIVQPGQ